MDTMGKLDLKVTVGLLVLGVAIGAVVLKITSPPSLPEQPAMQPSPPMAVPLSSPTAGARDMRKEDVASEREGPARLASPADASPSFPQASEAPPPPPAVPLAWVSGHVLRVSPSERHLVIGSHRIEEHKTVLASQQTIEWTDGTSFVRRAASAETPSTEVAITGQDIREGDPVTVIASQGGSDDRIVAAKVIVLDLPTPPLR